MNYEATGINKCSIHASTIWIWNALGMNIITKRHAACPLFWDRGTQYHHYNLQYMHKRGNPNAFTWEETLLFIFVRSKFVIELKDLTETSILTNTYIVVIPGCL